MMRRKITNEDPAALLKKRKIADIAGSVGMILIVVGMLIPVFNMFDISILPICKWIFTIGALLFAGSKCISTLPSSASFRLRRLKRLEFWAGICFIIAAGFWFYNQSKFGNTPYAGTLTIIRDTILFTLSGAMLQLVAAWLIYFREKKEARDSQTQPDNLS